MKLYLTSSIFALLTAGACAAGSDMTSLTDRIAADLEVEPGKYTYNELVRIRSELPADRSARIAVIDKEHEAFSEKLRNAVGAPMVEVTRRAN